MMSDDFNRESLFNSAVIYCVCSMERIQMDGEVGPKRELECWNQVSGNSDWLTIANLSSFWKLI